MYRFTKELEQNGEVVVECSGLRTGVMRLFILVAPLFQIGRAFGTGKLVRRIVFLANGRIGVAFPLMQQREEVAKLVAIISNPQRPVARGVRAGHEAEATIRGHAKAGEMVLLKRFKRRSPCVSRTIRSQLNGEDRRASRVNGDHNGRVDGTNRIAQINTFAKNGDEIGWLSTV